MTAPQMDLREGVALLMGVVGELLAHNAQTLPANIDAIPYTAGQIRAMLAVPPPAYPDGVPTSDEGTASSNEA